MFVEASWWIFVDVHAKLCLLNSIFWRSDSLFTLSEANKWLWEYEKDSLDHKSFGVRVFELGIGEKPKGQSWCHLF